MSDTLRNSKNDIGANVRQHMVGFLNTALATAIDLTAQTKQAHWNVRGPNFAALHGLFDAQNALALTMVDDIAERITALGGFAEGRVTHVASNSKLPAYPTTTAEVEHVQAMIGAFATFGAFTRQGIDMADEKGDKVTADLLTGITRELDKQLWMLEAHLAK